ncbi:hypothetical protein H5410_041216, partial [Solanum commersonii]
MHLLLEECWSNQEWKNLRQKRAHCDATIAFPIFAAEKFAATWTKMLLLQIYGHLQTFANICNCISHDLDSTSGNCRNEHWSGNSTLHYTCYDYDDNEKLEQLCCCMTIMTGPGVFVAIDTLH